LISLLRQVGIAYQLLADYQCAEALEQFKKLPPSQLKTGWVSDQIARCHFEMSQWDECHKAYEQMLRLEPYRLEGLEFYSTCLWHLKKQTDLCYLSNYVLERSLLAPETWCVVGNCYSLQKEYELAIKSFGRSI
jgi:anaphase-promoting complex subunit 3